MGTVGVGPAGVLGRGGIGSGAPSTLWSGAGSRFGSRVPNTAKITKVSANATPVVNQPRRFDLPSTVVETTG
jgi:hypothetical protein